MDKNSYGLVRQVAKEADAFNQHLEEFYWKGFTIIENILDPDELKQLITDLHTVYDLQESSIGRSNMEKIGESYMARALLAYSDSYFKLAMREDMLAYVRRIIGEYFVLHLQNGIINMPGKAHHQSMWHRDFPYQNWVCSEPLACNLYYCLDAFDSTTGATWILPFSHKNGSIPSEEYIEKHAIQIECPPGSVILFDTMVLHRAGYNRSEIIRRGVNHVYTKAIIRQQIDLPIIFNGRFSDDPIYKMIIGYDTKTPTSVDDFRKRRIEKLK